VRRVVPTPKFARAYKRLVGKQPQTAAQIEQALRQIATDPFHGSLETHKLKGALTGVWSCSAGYDLRILFEFVKNEPEDDVLLINIGTHDEVY
jgi:mRNA-degrading endonuclease YafQ of YafQ-DinJ toxin-antitoxin module